MLEDCSYTKNMPIIYYYVIGMTFENTFSDHKQLIALLKVRWELQLCNGMSLLTTNGSIV